MMTPVSQKLSAAKKKHFTKYVGPFYRATCSRVDRWRRGSKPMQSLFALPPKVAPSDEETVSDEDASASSPVEEKKDSDENPF